MFHVKRRESDSESASHADRDVPRGTWLPERALARARPTAGARRPAPAGPCAAQAKWAPRGDHGRGRAEARAPPGPPPASGRARRPGGSLTTRMPPTATRPAAISAVTAGRAKLRAVTRSKRLPDRRVAAPSPRPGPRATSTRSLEAQLARSGPRAPRTGVPTTRSARPARSGHAAASTSPGTPPPVPRSANRAGRPPSAASTRLGEARGRGRDGLDRIPGRGTRRSGRRSRTSSSSRLGSHRSRSRRADHHAAPGLFALGAGRRPRRSRRPCRGRPCGRAASSARAHARAPVSRTSSATWRANAASASRRRSR